MNTKRNVRKPRQPKVLANNASPAPFRQKKKKKGKGRPSGGPRINKSMRPHVHKVCSITDPFCPASKGSKWPDGTSGNTFSEQFRGTTTVVTNGQGSAAASFCASAPFGWLVSSALASPGPNTIDISGLWTVGSPTNAYTTNSLLSTAGTEYRIVSFGVIVRCIASATTAQGLVNMVTVSNSPVNTTVWTLGQSSYAESVTHAIQPGFEATFLSRPRGGSRPFSAQSTSIMSVLQNNDWSCFVLEVIGGPNSTAILSCEWYMNIEFLVNTQQPLARLAPPNPPALLAHTQAVSQIHSGLSSFIKGGISTVEDTIWNAATDAFKELPFAAAFF